MDLKGLKKPLGIHEIDFRIQSINKGGYATILAYKDARVDMNRLDDVCGALNWKREHTRDNHNCIISVWDDAKKMWISKEDTGTESNTEKAKGLASDSFKRAGFNWGIGRELYDYPIISVKLNANEFELKDNRAKQTWNLRLRDWNWSSNWVDGILESLTCNDEKGVKRFSFGKASSVPKSEKPDAIKESLKNAIGECKTLADLQTMWTNNKELQSEKFFIKLKDDRKKILTDNGITE